VWSSRVPDRLAAGPTPAIEEAAASRADDDVPPTHDAFRWAVDLEAARAAGMALTVSDDDLTQDRRLASGLTRLVVLGVDWTLEPDEAAEALDALLGAHAATGDLAFVAPGTPTNNTGSNRSGFTTAPDQQVAEWAPPVVGNDPDASTDFAAGRLAAALSVSPSTVAVAPGASGRHHHVASALVDALWEATGGYYATELLEPLGSDALTADLRVHAANHLHPSGPYPSVRIGPQPYGILPVVAGRFEPSSDNAAEAAIMSVGSALRRLWDPLTKTVPHLGRAGEQANVDEVMLDLLQRTPVPWSMRWREVIPPPQWSATSWGTTHRMYQAPYLSTVMGLLGLPAKLTARIEYLTASEESHPLRVPLVAKGDEGTDYLTEIATLTRDGAEGRRELNLRQNSIALLEALVAFAATQEIDKAAAAELSFDMTPDQKAAAGFVRLGVRTPDLVRVEQPDPGRAPLEFSSARELASAVVPGRAVLAHDRVAERVSGSLSELVRDLNNPAHSVARFLAAVEALTTVDPAELEWAFRGVLDLYSSRLDAWFTSLADSRLARHRAARPTGVHLGCYGWVEDLRPDTGAEGESLGYVMTPTLAHAVAAAVLRSGRRAHAEAEAFDLDLSSHRVREAVSLLEGVAAGQSIAALVGYRIERRLREAGLADLTVPLRLVAPLQSRDPDHEAPVESVAARDVVDGVRLLSIFAGPTQGWNAVVQRIGAQSRRTEIEGVLRAVASTYDAVADVLFAEAVHQTAVGNLERASAAAGALDRQERPVEPEVIRTPREGATVTNRVLVALRKTTRARGWPARGIRGTAEPRLDSWLGGVLGRASDIGVTGRVRRPSPIEGEPDQVTELGVVSAADLRLSPLALVLTALLPDPGGGTELDARVRAVLRDRVSDLAPGDRIEVDESSLLHTVTSWAARLVSGSRPLEPTDLTLPQVTASEPAGTVDVAELATRVAKVIDGVRSALATLQSAAAPDGPLAPLRRALARASELAGTEALPRTARGDPDELVSLREQANEIATLLNERVDALEKLSGKPLSPSEDPVDRQLELAALALGSHQPMLPRFSVTAPADQRSSVADRAALLDGDETVVIAWLNRASLVRPDLDPLCGLLTHAEANGRDVVAELAVAQLPHRPGARWCELPFGPEGPPPAGTIGFAVVAPDGFDPRRTHAGLSVDAWAEVIPSTDHTSGLTFHYDAPGARPPQAIVLAVHPEPDPERWDLNTLLDTVNETAALARLRTLSLKETGAFAALLPALYLPNNYTRDVPSVSFKGLVEQAQSANLASKPTSIKGK
jgi:hypothetical protein